MLVASARRNFISMDEMTLLRMYSPSSSRSCAVVRSPCGNFPRRLVSLATPLVLETINRVVDKSLNLDDCHIKKKFDCSHYFVYVYLFVILTSVVTKLLIMLRNPLIWQDSNYFIFFNDKFHVVFAIWPATNNYCS